MIVIKTTIPPNPLSGLNQEATLVQLYYVDFSISEAKIKLLINQLDEFNIPLTTPMTSYETYVELSNSRRVDANGVVIDGTSYPPLENETPEDYAIRFAGILAAGTPQFDFWITPLVGDLQAMLDSIKTTL